jgi:hypothetical protein
LVISSSLASLAKFMPFSAINIRSSGSNTKSNPLADFWSPYNEEPLDENYHFMGEYSFLFALPSDRVRELRRRQDAISHPDDPSRRGAHKIDQNVKFHDQPSARPPHRRYRGVSPWGTSRRWPILGH